jgi:hypothetical protein
MRLNRSDPLISVDIADPYCSGTGAGCHVELSGHFHVRRNRMKGGESLVENVRVWLCLCGIALSAVGSILCLGPLLGWGLGCLMIGTSGIYVGLLIPDEIRFSLRSLLIAMTLFAVLLGAVMYAFG